MKRGTLYSKGDEDKHLDLKKQNDVILLGRTGSGKSTLINFILDMTGAPDDMGAKIGDTADPCTSETTCYTFGNLNLYDTVGLDDSESKDESTSCDLFKLSVGADISLIIILVEITSRIQESIINMLKKYRELFSEFFDKIRVVFTKCPEMLDENYYNSYCDKIVDVLDYSHEFALLTIQTPEDHMRPRNLHTFGLFSRWCNTSSKVNVARRIMMVPNVFHSRISDLQNSVKNRLMMIDEEKKKQSRLQEINYELSLLHNKLGQIDNDFVEVIRSKEVVNVHNGLPKKMEYIFNTYQPKLERVNVIAMRPFSSLSHEVDGSVVTIQWGHRAFKDARYIIETHLKSKDVRSAEISMIKSRIKSLEEESSRNSLVLERYEPSKEELVIRKIASIRLSEPIEGRLLVALVSIGFRATVDQFGVLSGLIDIYDICCGLRKVDPKDIYQCKRLIFND